MTWEDILKQNKFKVGDVVVPTFRDTRPIRTAEGKIDRNRISDSMLYLVVSIEGDRIRVEEIGHPNEKSGRPINREFLARQFDFLTDDYFKPDTSERDAERAFESRLYGSSKSRGNIEKKADFNHDAKPNSSGDHPDNPNVVYYEIESHYGSYLLTSPAKEGSVLMGQDDAREMFGDRFEEGYGYFLPDYLEYFEVEE